MVKTLSKIGNSAGITLDKAVLELAHLKLGDKVAVTVRNGSIVLTPANVGFSDEEIDKAADEIFKRYDKAFKKLAE
jgi:putative addiction module antidote